MLLIGFVQTFRPLLTILYKSLGASTLCFLLIVAGSVQAADLEDARDLMEAGSFVQAREQFEVLARSLSATTSARSSGICARR